MDTDESKVDLENYRPWQEKLGLSADTRVLMGNIRAGKRAYCDMVGLATTHNCDRLLTPIELSRILKSCDLSIEPRIQGTVAIKTSNSLG